jgi:methylenetetrahydrofolate dehydrogenase (NADP+)/methenyltetrahydrofolate cyclohydrolase
MSARLLDGKVLAGQLKDKLKRDVDALTAKAGRPPVVTSILTGEDPSAASYATSQKRTAEALGIEYRLMNLPSSISKEEFVQLIEQLNADRGVDGIMINKPLPPQIDYGTIANLVCDTKDIEGLNVGNIGKMFLAKTRLLPCTAAAVMEHLKFAGVALRGKEAVVIGRSEIVGKPLMILLLAESATVTVCHSGTSEAGKLVEHVKGADVVVAAIGKANFVKGDWIKPGAVVIDVGINQEGSKIVGDVEFSSVSKVASAVTPVPGGVGPVTSVLLMRNVIEAFKQHNNLK